MPPGEEHSSGAEEVEEVASTPVDPALFDSLDECADRVRNLERVLENLERALETRDLIGQAKGILMARQAVSADDAFDILRRASQRTNKKLRDVAAQVVAGRGWDDGSPLH